MKLQEYSWKINKIIQRDRNDENQMKLERFCHEMSKNIDNNGFYPANGFYKESYSQDNISIYCTDIGGIVNFDAIISYFIDEGYFNIHFQDGYSDSAGWSEIEWAWDIEGDEFRDCYKELKEIIKKAEKIQMENVEDED